MQRRFGLLQATALNMSTMIGIGPFITIPVLMAAMGGPQAMLGWIVALVIACADGLVWSELGAAMPGSGGSYVYLRDGFGRKIFGQAMAFLFIWQFLLSGPLEIASGYIGFAQYAHYLWPGLSAAQTRLLMAGVGVVMIILLYRQIGAIGRITVALWIGTLLTVSMVVFTGPFHFDPKLAFDFPPDAFGFSLGFFVGLGAAARVGVYDYLGYYDICYLGDEVKNPGRVIPRSILISLVVVAGIYMTMNLAIIGVVPWREFVPPPGTPLADPPPPVVSMFMERIYGGKIASVFTVLVLWTAFASCFSLLLGYSRIPFAAARDGNFFKFFGKLHPRKNFPHVSLLLVGGLAILCSQLPLMTVIEALLTTRILVQFIGQIAALAWLRRNAPEMKRPFKMWLYPLPALIALVGWIFLFATTGWQTKLYAVAVLTGGRGSVSAVAALAREARRFSIEELRTSAIVTGDGRMNSAQPPVENDVPPATGWGLSAPKPFSYFFLGAIIILVGWFRLGTPFLVLFFSYYILDQLQVFKRKWIKVLIFVSLVTFACGGLAYFLDQTVRNFTQVVEKAIPAIIAYARSHNFDLPFTDWESLRGFLLDTAKGELHFLGLLAKNATRQFVFLLIGIVIATSLFLTPFSKFLVKNGRVEGNVYAVYCTEIAARFYSFYQSFARVMGAQLIISTINTGLTAIFVVAIGMPYAPIAIGVTFLCGLLPIVGNLISNTVLVSIGFTHSPKMAVTALIYLVVIHKLEYFLNSKIIGKQIKNPVWLTLIGLILGERLMGITGMVLAPVILHFVKEEASKYLYRAKDTPAPAAVEK